MEGGPKPLVNLGGKTMLARTVQHYLDSALDEVIVVLGYAAESVHGSLPADPRLRIVFNPDWAEGLSSSIRAALRDLDAEYVLLGLADMPWVSPFVIEQILARRSPGRAVAPVFKGQRGHPVLLSRDWFEGLLALTGDRGAARLLQERSHLVDLIEVEEPGVLRDLDFARDIPAPLPRVVVWGGGDLGSGVAHRLYVSGFPVLILELEQPRMLRSHVSFARAVYEHDVEVEGVAARRYGRPPLDWRTCLPVIVDPSGSVLRELRPDVLVDARLLKRASGLSKELAPLVLALGPGIEAGVDCHAVIETDRGHFLGQVIWQGQARPDTGVPGVLGGESVRRLLRAPGAGVFTAAVEAGTRVAEGERVGDVDGAPVLAQVAGVLRGLIQSGLEVSAGEKIGDVDPRQEVDLHTISDKARAIGGGVLEAIMRWRFGGATSPASLRPSESPSRP